MTAQVGKSSDPKVCVLGGWGWGTRARAVTVFGGWVWMHLWNV